MVEKTPKPGSILASLPEPITVYAVSSGSYSDYSVDVLFAAREDAVAYCAALNKVSVEDMTYWIDVEGMGYRTKKQQNARLVEMNSDRYRTLKKRFHYAAPYVESFDFYGAESA